MCFRNAYASKDRLTVLVGGYDMEASEETDRLEFEIEKIIVHYNYKPTESHANDIAIIKVNGSIEFNENVQPICLLKEGEPNFFNEKCFWQTRAGSGKSIIFCRF